MPKTKSPVCWDKSHHSIFEDFAIDLRDYTKTKKLPAYGGQDVNYCLELQEKRLADKGLRLEYEIVPRGLFADGGGLGRSWSDARYESRMEYRTCRLSRILYRERKKVFEKKQDAIFYQIITNVHNPVAAAGDLYTCPSCGAVSSLGELQKGCPYCGTFFAMKDLFPKVTNFFFIKDSGGTGQELKRSILQIVIPCILASVIGYSFYFYGQAAGAGRLIFSLIRGIFAGAIFGGIAGYLLWAFLKLGSLFVEAGKSIPMLLNSMGSDKRFVAMMRRYSPEFSYEYFSGRVVSMLKMILFSKQPGELPTYLGEPVDGLFADIVESSYTGAVALKRFRVQGDYCYVTVDAYLEDIYDADGRIRSRKDTFRMELMRNIARPVDFQFSIRKIHCKSCGASFDAARRKTCPNCGQRYEVGDDDWVVLKLARC